MSPDCAFLGTTQHWLKHLLLLLDIRINIYFNRNATVLFYLSFLLFITRSWNFTLSLSLQRKLCQGEVSLYADLISLTGLDHNPTSKFVVDFIKTNRVQTKETGGQPYSDTSPYNWGVIGPLSHIIWPLSHSLFHHWASLSCHLASLSGYLAFFIIWPNWEVIGPLSLVIWPLSLWSFSLFLAFTLSSFGVSVCSLGLNLWSFSLTLVIWLLTLSSFGPTERSLCLTLWSFGCSLSLSHHLA